MNWDTTDHAIYPLPTTTAPEWDAVNVATWAGAAALVVGFWAGVWRLGGWLLDALRWVTFALAGAAFVVCIAASMTALMYWAIDLF